MKNKILKYVLWCIGIGWLLFSVYYVGQDFYGKYQTNVIQTSYQKGYTDAINALIIEAKKCQKVTAHSGDEKVELIWTNCLNNNQTTESQNQENNS